MTRSLKVPAAESLALAGYTGVLGLLVLGLAAATFPAVRSLVDLHEREITTLLMLLFLDLLVVWAMAIRLLAKDRDLPDRLRTTWILLLALLFVFAGPAFVLWRRKRQAGPGA